MKQFTRSYLCKLLFALIFGLIPLINITAQSQNHYTISGTVCDKSYQPLPGVVVSLSGVSDSTKVYSTITSLDGLFISPITSGEYRMTISLIGYEKKIINVETSSTEIISMGIILLEESAHNLNEVTVTGSRSHIKLLAGKTIVNPANSILLSQSNSLEVLRGIPGVIINEDGSIILNGQQGVKIQINGKDAYLSGPELVGLLKSTHASSIAEVEVVTSPSAEYDASGKAGVINIKLKKMSADNSTFAVNVNNQQGKNRRGELWSKGTFRRNKVGVWGNYFYSDGDKAKHGVIYREVQRIVNLKSKKTAASQYISLINKDKANNFKLGVDYDISTTVGLEVSGGLNLFNRNNPGSSLTSFMSDALSVDSTLNAVTNTRYKQSTPLAGFRFTYKDDTKQEFNFWADYLSFNHTETTTLNTSTADIATLPIYNSLLGDLNNKIQIFSMQSDYSKPIKDIVQIQLGAKSAWINTNNKAIYKRQSDTKDIIDMSYSSRYSYRERSNAAYLQFNVNLKKWSLQAGLRFEDVLIKGNIYDLSATKSDSTYAITYSNFFPNLSVLYNIQDDHDFGISYNRRITRPNYRDLSPLGYIVDEYMVIKGNSELKAELTHNVELSYIWKKMYRTSIFYNVTNDAIAQGFRELPNKGVLIIPENMSLNKRVGIRLDASRIVDFKWWQMGGSMTVYKASNKWSEFGLKKQNKQLTPMFTASNSFVMPKGWSAQLTAYYNGKMSLGQMVLPSGWSVSGGIRKTLFNDRLNVHMYANDIFASIRERAFFESGSIRGFSNIRYDETSIGISVYFSIRQEKQKKNNDRTIEESSRINY